MNTRGHVWYKFGTYPSGILYIFSDFDTALTHIRVSIWRCGFSSLVTAVTITSFTWTSILFIRRFYYTLINILRNLHEIKHVNWFKKTIDSQSKPCTHDCLLQLLGIMLSGISFNSVTPIWSASFDPGNKAKY